MLNYRDLRMAIAIVLCIACFSCFAQDKPQLDKETATSVAMCRFPPLEGKCYLINKEGRKYILLVDPVDEEEKAVYWVNKHWDGKVIMPEHIMLIWEKRGDV